MASITLLSKTTKDPVNLYIRFNFKISEKRQDLFVKTGIMVKNKWWSNKKQNFNAVSDKFPKEILRERINNLKDFVLNEFNEAYAVGESIDKVWLEEIIRKFNKQLDEGEPNYKIYFTEFVKKFIEDSHQRVNIESGRVISPKTINKYKTTLKRLEEYEEREGRRLRHKDINLEFHKSLVSYLKIEGNYGNSTIEKYVSQIKMFCREAEVKGYDVSAEYKSRNFTFRRQKPLDPYLKPSEIDAIYNLKIENERLDKIRDLFIVGLHTGLRVSDLKDLKRLTVNGDNIEIASTKKTGKPAKIPIHPYVRSVLNKRNGNLPSFSITPKSLEILFNEKIKEICYNAGITQDELGDKRDKKTKRDVRGFYPKYQLVSSHICRRSFVTNHYGKISNQAIMAITTHASEKLLLDYVKLSNEDHIETVRELWKQEELNKSSMKIVS